jgi:signal transduction histidine kinase
VFQDITAQKAAEGALRDNRQMLRVVANAVPAAINAKDLESRHVFMNRFRAGLYGVTTERAAGKAPERLIGLEYGASTRRLDQKPIPAGTPLVCFEDEVQFGQGPRRAWLTTKNLPRDEMEGVRYIATASLGITGRKRLERQHVHAQKMEALGVLAGAVAHEFNNMLFAVIGLTGSARNVLREGGEARTSLESILEAGARVRGLVQQILPSGRQDEIRPRSPDLQDALAAALEPVGVSLPVTIGIRRSLDTACGRHWPTRPMSIGSPRTSPLMRRTPCVRRAGRCISASIG